MPGERGSCFERREARKAQGRGVARAGRRIRGARRRGARPLAEGAGERGAIRLGHRVASNRMRRAPRVLDDIRHEGGQAGGKGANPLSLALGHLARHPQGGRALEGRGVPLARPIKGDTRLLRALGRREGVALRHREFRVRGEVLAQERAFALLVVVALDERPRDDLGPASADVGFLGLTEARPCGDQRTDDFRVSGLRGLDLGGRGVLTDEGVLGLLDGGHVCVLLVCLPGKAGVGGPPRGYALSTRLHHKGEGCKGRGVPWPMCDRRHTLSRRAGIPRGDPDAPRRAEARAAPDIVADRALRGYPRDIRAYLLS